MTTLEVRCTQSPLAMLTVRDATLRTVGRGTGSVTIDVVPGAHEVTAEAVGQRDVRLVRVADGGTQRVEVEVAPPESAVPDDRDGTHIAAAMAASASLSGLQANSGALVVVVRRTRPGAVPADATSATLSDPRTGVAIPLQWRSGPGDRSVATWASIGAPGSYALVLGNDVRSALVAPVWSGYQTLLFLRDGGEGLVPSLAAMLCVPTSRPWAGMDRVDELTVQLQAALADGSEVSRSGVVLFEDEIARAATPASGSPLASFLIADLMLRSGQQNLWARRRSLLVESNAASVLPSDFFAFDLRAAELSDTVPPPSVVGAVREAPLLASSGDALMRHEAAHLRSLSVPTGEQFAARLSSPLWFRWSRPWSAETEFAPAAVRLLNVRRREAAAALAGRLSLDELDALIEASRDDPATWRLLTYVAAECRIWNVTPDVVVEGRELGHLVAATGVPAAQLSSVIAPPIVQVAAQAGAPAAPQPGPVGRPEASPGRPRRRGLGIVAAIVAALVIAIVVLVIWAIIDELGDDTTEPTIVTTQVATSQIDTTDVADTAPPDTAPPDTVLPDTAPPDTAPPDTVPPDTEPPDTAPPVVANRAPVASEDAVETLEDQAVSIDVLANDLDDDGDALTIAVATPQLGTAEVVDNRILYTPVPDQTEAVSFDYSIDDGRGGADSASVTVRVLPVNDAPFAFDDVASVLEGESVSIDVLANDVDNDSAAMTAEPVDPPQSGQVSGGDDGSIDYFAGVASAGTDSFTYQANDGVDLSEPATVTVNVFPTLQTTDVEGFEGQSNVTVAVRLRAPIDVPVDIAFEAQPDTASEADYSLEPGSESIAAGDTTATIAVGIVDDFFSELDETFTIVFTASFPGGVDATVEATVTIPENDQLI